MTRIIICSSPWTLERRKNKYTTMFLFFVGNALLIFFSGIKFEEIVVQAH